MKLSRALVCGAAVLVALLLTLPHYRHTAPNNFGGASTFHPLQNARLDASAAEDAVIMLNISHVSDQRTNRVVLPRVAVVTLNYVAEGTRLEQGSIHWAFPFSLHNKWAYTRHHGIDLIVEDNAIVDKRRDVPWAKLSVFKKWLPKYRWLMWMDMDALFMQFSGEIERILDDRYDLIIATDWNGINLGIFFIQNSPSALELLDHWWNAPLEKWNPYREQSALTWLIESNATVARRVLLKNPREFNSYPLDFAWGHEESQYHLGDFIAHFPDCRGIRMCPEKFRQFYYDALTRNRVAEIDLNARKLPRRVVPGDRDPFS